MEVYSNSQTGPLPGPPGSYLSGLSAHIFNQIKLLSLLFQHTSTVECRSCVVYAQDNNSLPVWFILSPAHHHISINSQPFLVGIVSKAYHSKVKPHAATLKLEVKRHWKVYFSTNRQTHPTNWKIDKCHEYLLSHPIPMSEKADLDFLESEIEERHTVNDQHKSGEGRQSDHTSFLVI